MEVALAIQSETGCPCSFFINISQVKKKVCTDRSDHSYIVYIYMYTFGF